MRLLDSRMVLALLLVPAPALAAARHLPVKAKMTAARPAPAATPESLMADAHAAVTRGDTELAMRLAQSAIVADPALPATYDTLADVYAAMALPDFARDYYEEALSIDPGDAAATKAIAELDGKSNTRAAQAEMSKRDTDGTKTGTP